MQEARSFLLLGRRLVLVVVVILLVILLLVIFFAIFITTIFIVIIAIAAISVAAWQYGATFHQRYEALTGKEGPDRVKHEKE